MSEDRLHVVFGTGQVGRALSARLAGLGLAVRVVSRHRPAGLVDGVDWRAADASDPQAADDAAEGAAVIYQCLNAPYTSWQERFPPLQRGVLSAAERQGALLVSLENVYGYGPTGGRPMTEDLSLAATTVKGRTRAAMTQELLAAAEAGRVHIAIGRASDFFGAGVTESTLGKRVFANAVAGKRADFLGNPDLPHTYSYVPDIAAGLATLGTDERAVGGVWHLPGPETVTTRQLLELIAVNVGHPVAIRSMPKFLLRALGLVNPMMRELAEMAYEFEEPFVLDTSKYESTFGAAGTPLAAAITTTIVWYRNTADTPPEERPTSSPAPETPLPPAKTALRASTVQTGPVPRSESSPTPPPANGSDARPSPKTATPLDRSA
jgi:nucleoside-diphosphate-sugar epimerase